MLVEVGESMKGPSIAVCIAMIIIIAIISPFYFVWMGMGVAGVRLGPDGPYLLKLLINLIIYLPGIAILAEIFFILAVIANENASSLVMKGNFVIILSPILANILLYILYQL